MTDALDERLVALCEKLDLTSADRYYLLSRALLTEIDRLGGPEIFDKDQRNGGAPVFWTMKRDIELVNFVNARIADRNTPPLAIRQAWKKFKETPKAGKPLTLSAVRAEYYRAKRFIQSVPFIPAVMASVDRVPRSRAMQAFVDWAARGAIVDTPYGGQPIAVDHLRNKWPTAT